MSACVQIDDPAGATKQSGLESLEKMLLSYPSSCCLTAFLGLMGSTSLRREWNSIARGSLPLARDPDHFLDHAVEG